MTVERTPETSNTNGTEIPRLRLVPELGTYAIPRVIDWGPRDREAARQISDRPTASLTETQREEPHEFSGFGD